MQDKYVSLNPENTAREEKAIRANLHAQRVRDAQGGEAAALLGAQFGLTASVLTYSMLANSPAGFKMYPFTAAKVPGYTKIGGAYVLFFLLSHGYVMSKFGDSKQLRYLQWNRGSILKGTKSWDRAD